MTEASPLGKQIDERQDNFNALRLFSAFAILVSHYFPLRDGSDANEPFWRLSGVCNIGKIVTYVCFVISGMAVTRAYLHNPGPGRYLLHRLARLLPALWVVVVFCIFAVGLPLTKLSGAAFVKNHETLKFAANAAMYPNHYSLPGVFTGFTAKDQRSVVNGSLWVVAPLFFVYLIVPVVGAVKLLRPLPLLGFALVCFLGWEAYAIHGIPATSRLAKYSVWIEFIPHLSFFFLCGAAAAVWEGKLPLNIWLFLSCLLAVGIFLPTRAAYSILTLAIPYVTIYLSFARWSWLGPLNAVGVIAWGVYLFSWPVQQLFMRVWTPGGSGVELVVYPCLLCAGLAAVTWVAVEAPVGRWLRGKRETARPAA